MKNANAFPRFGAVLLGLALAQGATAADGPDWIETSNDNAQILLKVMAEFQPEQAASLGVDGYDKDILDLRENIVQRSMEATAAAGNKLEQRLAQAKDPRVRQDLEILIKAANDSVESTQLQRKYMLPYFDLPLTLFFGTQTLVDPQIPKERQQAIVARLRKYAGLADGYQPITELAKARTSEHFGENLVGPYKAEVQQNLNDAPRMIEGIKQLLANSEVEGWQEPFDTLAGQLRDYEDWVKTEILPRARTDHQLPEPIYANQLKNVGVDMDPRELIDVAQRSFMEIRTEMQSLAPIVAERHGFKSSDYRDVIRELKKDQLVGKDILPRYRDRLHEIEGIIREHELVTLPERDARIRLASEAESAAIPAPHLKPPRLIGNTGEYAEFVLPLNIPSDSGKELEQNDFTFDAASWTLIAHEARPGHELQFSSIIEQGVSIPRVVFAFNSANVEGWALYAESFMQPYEPPEGQLIALQMRLQRAARAFLDPMLNLGMMQPEDARRFITEEVVLSPAMAKQEVDRYTFRAPGQATSYFYGYLNLMQLRAQTELALGEKFNARAFHDFILSQGLLPPDLLAKAVKEQFIPAQRGET